VSWEFEVYHRAVSVEAAKLKQMPEVKVHNRKNARKYKFVLDVDSVWIDLGNGKQFSQPSVEEIHEFARELDPECQRPPPWNDEEAWERRKEREHGIFQIHFTDKQAAIDAADRVAEIAEEEFSNQGASS